MILDNKRWGFGDWCCAGVIVFAAVYLAVEVLAAFLCGAVQQAVR